MTDPIMAVATRFYNDLAVRNNNLSGGGRPMPVGEGIDDAPSFGDNLARAINGVSAQQDNAASTLQAFLRGDDVAVHQVMAATEEAQISLEMLIEVRNKFTEAYRTLTTMQG